ncbi:ABC transporter permease [Millisia brevis]|uniref:ABC transporter permease n=1 Tax=Millisia brevis TaxID=264148 RepID=UPI00082AD8D7|nr:ABC transporter permease [Millisia brevis]
MTTQSTANSPYDAPLPEVVGAAKESSLRALFVHSALQCKRLLTRWSRDPATMIQALLYPALTLLMFDIVLGDTITRATGAPAINGTVPMIILVGAMYGSIASGVGLREEAAKGLLGRFWTLPTHRAAGLLGRLMAEAIRVVITSLLILLIGILLGFRFTQGPIEFLGFIALPVLFGIAFSTFVTFLASGKAAQAGLVELVSILCTLMMFFNTGFVPLQAYPRDLQGVVGNQPMSVTIDAMRAMAVGGDVFEPAMKSLAWSLGLILVFTIPAIIGYRSAARRS